MTSTLRVLDLAMKMLGFDVVNQENVEKPTERLLIVQFKGLPAPCKAHGDVGIHAEYMILDDTNGDYLLLCAYHTDKVRTWAREAAEPEELGVIKIQELLRERNTYVVP